ncbi:hypothetical protein M231_01313 [Tremella mesenterica]|uniref:C3H1-type domain-containing protein n=1 Tax=Tremella mesenterica TaxID=5217 RepID=A0A4Q1BTS5_TREME|nr:hypothetical protein M231_01313 [Tremella mesenterica]
MSSSNSTDTPSSPLEPTTPPQSSISVEITLPTPSPASTFRNRAYSIDSPSAEGTFRKGHGRSVSFDHDIHDEETFKSKGELQNLNILKYNIPQRKSSTMTDEDTLLTETGKSLTIGERRKSPPKPLSFISRQPRGPPSAGLISPFSISAGLEVSKSSRLSNTASAKGLSIVPALSKGLRHSVIGLPGTHSIWSPSLTGGLGRGWISPALGSARSVGSASRRGLSVAVVTDGGELIAETPATPGLGPRRGSVISETSVNESAKIDPKAKEIILCRYYHTPGLTCTSRPCRFVHSLEGVVPQSAKLPIDKYRMLSPLKTPGLDPTGGIFAQAQMTPRDNDSTEMLKDAEPGETVIRPSDEGEVVGQVFLMSGGGKGPVGKSKSKFKTVKCNDYQEGHCPYGEYCSFIHEEPTLDRTKMEETPPQIVEGVLNTSNSSNPSIIWSRRSSLNSEKAPKVEPAALKPTNAWNRPLSFIISQQNNRDSGTNREEKRHSLNDTSVHDFKQSLSNLKLIPSVKIDETSVDKQRGGLSAFAPPFLKEPYKVDEHGELVKDPKLSERNINIPIPPTIINSETMNKNENKVSAWSKGPPKNLRKVTISEIPPSTPAHLRPPPTAYSLYGTDSDPATPWDPAIRYLKQQQAELNKPQTNISTKISEDVEENQAINPEYSNSIFEPPTPLPLSPPVFDPYYPWGMPMSPIVPEGTILPEIPGGLGVMWTPSGWAVQDAAMKNALRSTEIKFLNPNSRRGRPKEYYRSKPCKFFNEGFCPHGDSCSYQHVPNLNLSSELSTLSSMSKSNPNSNFNFNSKSNSNSETENEVIKDGLNDSNKKKEEEGKINLKIHTIPCKFFNSTRGCSNGDNCTFLHTLVLPPEVPMVEKPRPWRTKPCRHFQVGTCRLGDACHFAHVLDPNFKDYEPKDTPCRQWAMEGKCEMGNRCKYRHVEVGGTEGVTEERLARTFEEVRRKKELEEEDEDSDEEDDDDVEIVTEYTSPISASKSPTMKAWLSSVRG